jgi:hypothetical protein
MLYSTAMTRCEVPQSSFEWIRERFIVVEMEHPGAKKFLGLLSKSSQHLATTISLTRLPRVALAGRHLDGEYVGQDMVLFDVTSMRPCGLGPAFRSRFLKGEEWTKNLGFIYPRLITAPEVTEKRGPGLRIKYCPVEQAQDILREAASLWLREDPATPPPPDSLDLIQSILGDRATQR